MTTGTERQGSADGLSEICSCTWVGDQRTQGIDCPVHPKVDPDLCPKHKVRRDVESDCHVCHGDGEVFDDDPGMGGGYTTCWSCDGTGQGFMDCEFCLEEADDEI